MIDLSLINIILLLRLAPWRCKYTFSLLLSKVGR